MPEARVHKLDDRQRARLQGKVDYSGQHGAAVRCSSQPDDRPLKSRETDLAHCPIVASVYSLTFYWD
jgi:hypothetical protein